MFQTSTKSINNHFVFKRIPKFVDLHFYDESDMLVYF